MSNTQATSASASTGTDKTEQKTEQKTEAKAEAAKPFKIPDDFEITIDRSRNVAEVHGDAPYNLGFIQDGIPFDKAGRLINELCYDDKEYPHALGIIERKIKRRKQEAEAAKRAVVKDTSNPAGEGQKLDDDPDADVDLVAWAKGTQPLVLTVVYRVAQKRLGKHFRSFAEIVAAMVEKKMITQDEVKVL